MADTPGVSIFAKAWGTIASWIGYLWALKCEMNCLCCTIFEFSFIRGLCLLFTYISQSASGFTTPLSPKVPRTHEQRLIYDLMSQYQRQGRPILDPTHPIMVNLSLSLQQITNIDEREQLLVSRVWFTVSWQDELLRWNLSDYSGTRYVNLWPSDIWHPELAIGNSLSHVFDKSHQEIRLLCLNDGTVYWYPGGLVHTTCNIDIYLYPFDRQKCSIIIQSWTMFEREVSLHPISSKIDLSQYIENGEWRIEDTATWKHSVEYPLGFIGEIYFDVYMERKARFVMINILLPCLMMAALDLLVFCLTPDSGEKISLGMTVLLAFTVFQLVIFEIIPKTSDAVPLITQYLSALTTLTALSVVAAVFVLRLHHFDISIHDGRIIRTAVSTLVCLGPLLMCSSHRDIDKARGNRRKANSTSKSVLRRSHCSQEASIPFVTVNGPSSVPESPTWRMYRRNVTSLSTEIAQDESLTPNTRESASVCHSVRPESENEDEEFQFQKFRYRYAAVVCDRILLFVFLTLHIILVVVIFMKIPYREKVHVNYVPLFGGDGRNHLEHFDAK